MLNRLYSWYGKRVVWGAGALVALLVVIGIILSFGGDSDAEELGNAGLKQVRVAPAGMLDGTRELEFIGSVEAINEAMLESEVSGQITSVNVSLGSAVAPGQIIAQVENASERASVLQAEGAYEAALANTLDDSTDAITTYRSAFTTIDDILRNHIDELYNAARTSQPRFRMSGFGWVSKLENDRVEAGDVVETWQKKLFKESGDNTNSLLEEAENNLLFFAEYVGFLAEIISRQEPGVFSAAELATIESEFATARVSIDNDIASVQSARQDLLSGNALSSADATVKQALGALRLAEANLEKTIIRSPINGVVNVLEVKIGENVRSGTHIATVANNNALEITIFVNQNDRNSITVGDGVDLEGGGIGRITAIAPAINPNTRKIEVKIATDAGDIKNGDTLRVTIPLARTVDEDAPLRIPLEAVKLRGEETSVLRVDGEGRLESVPVTLSDVRGGFATIGAGLTRADAIVTDARGLRAGMEVMITE